MENWSIYAVDTIFILIISINLLQTYRTLIGSIAGIVKIDPIAGQMKLLLNDSWTKQFIE